MVGNEVKSPKVLCKPAFNYTEEIRKRRAKGSVLIDVIIRKDGSADNFRILKGLGYELNESAINTIAVKWLFRPGTKNGGPVEVRNNVEVIFHLY